MTKTYIGDGVYADFDGYQIELSTPRQDGEHVIYLDSSVYSALVRFVERIKHEHEPPKPPEGQ